jgi:hypothetical protein
LDACARLAEQPETCEARVPEVSGWSVGEQLEHLLLADRRMLDGIERVLQASADGDPPPARGRPTLVGSVILWTGLIPRGRAKAPESTEPGGMTAPDLAVGFAEARVGVEALQSRLSELGRIASTRAHPILGHFTPTQWLRFSGVHHRHHRKIIRDILRAIGPG